MANASMVAISKRKEEEMSTKQAEQQSSFSHEKLLAFVRTMIGEREGREDDEHPLPAGPWDRVIRVALERINVFGPHLDPWRVFGPGPQPWRIMESIFGPVPDPWRVFGPGPQPWRAMESVFGPLPDPWRVVFSSLAAKYPAIWDVIGGGPNFGAELALNPQQLQPRFAFLVSLAQTVISRAELLQEIADATRREGEQQGIIIVGGYIARFIDDICGNDFRFRWPFPWPRPNWLAKEVSGVDLVVMATQFDRAANETSNREFRQDLANASAKLAETGLSKMRS
jgi:hypothetical protein